MDSHGENQSSPPKCAAGCGFFGNPTCENLCSKCYRDLKGKPATQQQQLQPQQATTSAPTPAVITPSAPVSVPVPAASQSLSVASASGSPDDSSAASSPKKEKHKCFTCKKNVGLLGFKCRCEQEFCPKHRHAADHNCPFDYKTFDREKLEKANPVIQSEKIQKL